MSGVATSRLRFEEGHEILEVLLLGQSADYVAQRIQEGNVREYLAGQLGIPVTSIEDFDLLDAGIIYEESGVRLEVKVRNPGGHIAEWISDHWDCNWALYAHKHDINFVCDECDTDIIIRKEAFHDAHRPRVRSLRSGPHADTNPAKGA